MQCRVISLIIILFFPILTQANIAIVTDILKVQSKALSTTSNNTANQLANNLDAQIVNLYAIIDNDLVFDESDPEMLLKTVDIIYNHPIFQSRSGLTTSLSGISNLSEDVIFINDAYSAAKDIVGSLKAFKKVTQQVSSIFKLGDTAEKLRLRSHILNNLLQYGSGYNNVYLELKNNVNDYLILSNQVDQFSDFVSYLVAIGDAGSNSKDAYKAIDALIAALKPKVASETLINLRNGQWSKLVIQDYVIERWRKQGYDFSGMKAYTRDGEACLDFFDFSACKVKSNVTTDDVYAPDNSNYTESYYDFEVQITRSPLAGKENTFVIELPESIVNHPTLGQPVSVSYRADGIDILQSYAAFVTSVSPIPNSNVVKTFIFDLNAVKEIVTIEVNVQYSTDLPKLALGFLEFIPQLSELSLVDLPNDPTTDGFTLALRVCGDSINYAALRYKNTEQTEWQEESIKLIDGIAQEADCKKYTIDVSGWNIHRYAGSNQEIQFSLQASERTSATETLYIVNSSDTDNDGMRDSCELQYFGDLSKLPEDDEDADGLSNIHECEQGSNPILAGVLGITKEVDIKPYLLSNGSTVNDCFLDDSYWANVNILCRTTLDGDVVIVGNVELQNNSLDLNGYTLTVKGDLIHTGGTLNVNGGSLIVERDYLIQTPATESTEATFSHGLLQMAKSADRVLVKGNFVMDSSRSHIHYLSAGEFELRGDFSQLSSYAYISPDAQVNFQTNSTHKVILSGGAQQFIFFTNPWHSRFNQLELKNNPTNLSFVPAEIPSVTQVIYTGTLLELSSLDVRYYDFKLNHNVTVTPDEGEVVRLSGRTLDLNGYTLTVKGDLIHTGGTLNVNGGSLIVERDYLIQTPATESTEATFSHGLLQMAKSADRVLVKGNFVMDSSRSHIHYLSAGEFELRGDFSQLSSYAYISPDAQVNFQTNSTHKVILSGGAQQFIFFTNPWHSRFNQLELKNNPTNLSFVPAEIPSVTQVIYTGTLLELSSLDVRYYDFKLNHNVTVTPDEGEVVRLSGRTLDLNGYTLTVKGDLIHTGGTLNVNGGSLIVERDYLIQTPATESTEATFSHGLLQMAKSADRVLVKGNFVMDSSRSHIHYLSAGEFELRGDFSQLSSYAYISPDAQVNFQTNSTHKVILSGGAQQFIFFTNPVHSRFNILNLQNTSADGIWMTTKVSVIRLFNHQRNKFTLFDNSSANFVDYDGDGIKDHLDTYPTVPLDSIADQDGDGIPDKIEIANGLNPLDSADAKADTDGDGYSNLEEYLAGTDINDIASLPLPDSPIIYPELTTFHSRVAVSLEAFRHDSPIYYTLDGSMPTNVSMRYTGAFLLETSATVKAVAVRESGQISPITTKDYSVLNKAVWSPIPGLSWQWQLQGDFDDSVSARVYDLDLFDTPIETIAQLKETGHRVICYFNAGAWEDWRDDAPQFSEVVKGNTLAGYADEKWLDIRNFDDLKAVMTVRLDLAVSKDCDAVEPDNIDGYTQNTGFALTANDQIHYNLWLSNQANARGLSIGLKNDVEQIPTLEPFFDWALNEQCLEFNECDTLKPFIAANKAVFGVEYLTDQQTPDTANVCASTEADKYSWIIKTPELDSWVDSCADYREFIDLDNDGVVDYEDNCLNAENANQRDTDNDGYGNQCDADLNNDGATNFADFANFRQQFFTASPDADLNGDGIVNFADFAIFRSLFNQQPGPAAGH